MLQLHAHVPLASQGLSAGSPCPSGGGGTGAGVHGCFHHCDSTTAQGLRHAQLGSIVGGREEEVGIVWCWHAPRLLMKELGH